jgi:hypothetical protein
MEVGNIIVLSLIVSAFILFAVALAYADYATQQARRTRAGGTEKPEVLTTSAAVQHRDAA